jgi:hypothetical protein
MIYSFMAGHFSSEVDLGMTSNTVGEEKRILINERR